MIEIYPYITVSASGVPIESKITVKGIQIAPGLTVLSLLLGSAVFLRAQTGFDIPALPSGSHRPPKLLERYSARASVAPASTIAVQPFGFSVLGDSYLMRQQSLVSLDFLDEERLLFTFHVASGLMERGASGEGRGGCCGS